MGVGWCEWARTGLTPREARHEASKRMHSMLRVPAGRPDTVRLRTTVCSLFSSIVRASLRMPLLRVVDCSAACWYGAYVHAQRVLTVAQPHLGQAMRHKHAA